ncbi:MAG: hypothetical protein AVDCRST_MAG07-980, partial [uncultured Frankineae bacterium]
DHDQGDLPDVRGGRADPRGRLAPGVQLRAPVLLRLHLPHLPGGGAQARRRAGGRAAGLRRRPGTGVGAARRGARGAHRSPPVLRRPARLRPAAGHHRPAGRARRRPRLDL